MCCVVFLRYLHNKNVKASEIYSHESFMEKLKKEDSFLCCTDSKINAELIYNDFKDDEDCILIVSGVDEYVNLDSYKKVIFSPKIVYGLDSIMKRPVLPIIKNIQSIPRIWFNKYLDVEISRIYIITFQKKTIKEMILHPR